MAGFSVNGRNKTSYKVGSDGKVTVKVNGDPVGTFADKATARAFTSAMKAEAKTTRDTNKATKGKLATKSESGYTLTTSADLVKAAKGTDKKYIDLKKEAVKGGNELYRTIRKAGAEQLKTTLADNLSKYGGTAPAQTQTQTQASATARTSSTVSRTQKPVTARTSSTVSRTQKPVTNNATSRIANAVRSSSNAINKRAGVGQYRSKLRFK